MDMEVFLFSCRKNAIFPGAHNIGTAISGPRTAGKFFFGHEDSSEELESGNAPGAFLQTQLHVLDKIPRPMGTRPYTVLGWSLAPSQGERNSPQHPHWI